MNKRNKRMRNLLDQNAVRKVLVKHFNNELDKIEPTDILQNFENDKFIQEKVKKLGGDVFTNPKIEKFDDDDSLKLIEMSIRNCKLHIEQFLPLWLVEYSHKRKETLSEQESGK